MGEARQHAIAHKNHQEEQRKKIKEATEKVSKLVEHVAASEEGLEFFVFLADTCGFNRPSTLRVNGQQAGDPILSAYEEGRRSVFSGLRGFMTSSTRSKLEIAFGEGADNVA